MHLRQNAATKEWVLFAPERARRPEDFRVARAQHTHERPAHRPDCPFCPGQEVHTQGETLRYVDAEGRWTVRSFPNGFPAVEPGGSAHRRGDIMHHTMDAVGRHEVLTESPLHNTTLALQSLPEVRRVIEAWRQRVTELRRVPETDLVIVWKNHGDMAGTSLEHPHSQIVTLPITTWQVRHRLGDALRYYDDFGECVFCQMLDAEKTDEVRVVRSGRHFTAFVPYASYSPFSLWILPSRHHTCISLCTEDELDDLADVLRDVLARLYHGLGDPSYNLVLRMANRDTMNDAPFHWYLAVVPRLGKVAGFEMGTGMFINTSLPETDAAFLRQVTVPLAGASLCQ